MKDEFNLIRFLDAQSNNYERALIEIKNEKKTSHWMWYIFPQYKGLGRSAIAVAYAINSKQEALAYLNHPILGSRLIEITKAFLLIENKTAYNILGEPDNLKIKSSMTLFDAIQTENKLFNLVLEKYFESERCRNTLAFIQYNNNVITGKNLN